MTAADVLKEVVNTTDRRFLPGLLLAFISFLKTLGATGGKFKSLADFYKAYPRLHTTSSGKRANTLIVRHTTQDEYGKSKPASISIRPYYNEAERWIFEQKRFDYPSAAPHATQAWIDYEHWLEALLQLDVPALDRLEAATKQHVLDKYPTQDVDPDSIVREPPRFYLFIRDFKMEKQGTGEKTGAIYQGAVFGFVRADAPHLQVDVDRVRTGSKRVGRVGDIDAREGGSLILTAEVKQFTLKPDDVSDLAGFAADVAKNKALGMIVALDFEIGVREQLASMGLEPLSRSDLASLVRLWDPLKQRIAVQALTYFVQYKEKNSVLLDRIHKFFLGLEEQTSQSSNLATAADPLDTLTKPKLKAKQKRK